MNVNKQGVAAIIVNANNQLLMLDHIKHNKLSLPGGKVDPGEDAIFAISRELYEEVGIKNFSLAEHHIVLDDVTGVLFNIFVVLTNDTPFNKEPEKHRQMLWVSNKPENFKGKINRITFAALKKIFVDVGSEEYIEQSVRGDNVMSNEKAEKILELFLKSDNDGFSLALHMSSFKGKLTYENLKSWAQEFAEEDDWGAQLLIDDLEGNIDPDAELQNYLVKDRCEVSYPIFKFNQPDYNTQTYITPKNIRVHVHQMNTIGFGVSSFINNFDFSFINNLSADKSAFMYAFEELGIIQDFLFEQYQPLFDLLCDDIVDESGETQVSVFKQTLEKLQNQHVFYCMPKIHANGDLYLSCTVKA